MAVQLESEVDFQLQLENFEGPFDLLLTLIGRKELEITQISLAKVTGEFLAFVKTLDPKKELETASEFLVVAATLLDMKLASLLPQGELVDAEDAGLLESRDLLFAKLLQYRAFKEVSTWFATSFEIEGQRIPRAVRLEERYRNLRPELDWKTSLEEFALIAQEVFTPKEIPQVQLSHLHAPKVSLREQVGILISKLKAKGRQTFQELIADTKDRAEMVARFLGVLELYKAGAVGLEQEKTFGPIDISWREKNIDPDQLGSLGDDYDS